MNEEIKTTSTTEPRPRRLRRSVVDRRIAGVCGGVAEYLNLDPLIVRLLWFISIFINGIGVFAYIAAWIIIPESDRPVEISPPRPRSQSGQYVWGIILILLGVILLADKFDWYFLVPWRWHYILPYWFNWGVFVSFFIILLGFLLIFRVTGKDLAKPSGIISSTQATTEIHTEPVVSSHEGESKMLEKRLTRALEERMIGGVCGGLAKYFNIDPSFVRIGFVLMTLFSGVLIGIVTYIVMMIVVPEENSGQSPFGAAKNPATSVGNV